MIRVLWLLSLLATSAWATEPGLEVAPATTHEVTSTEPREHEAAAHGEHAEAAHGEHAAVYTADDDHDGVPNWRDADAGDHYVATKLLKHLFNLALFLGVMGWFAWPRVKDSFYARRVTVREALVTADAKLTEARQRHDQVLARLARLEGEIEELRARASAEANAEVARIDARAAEADARLRDSVAQHVHDEVDRAKKAVRAEAVDLAVKLAEGLLSQRMTQADQAALAGALLAKVTTHDGVADA